MCPERFAVNDPRNEGVALRVGVEAALMHCGGQMMCVLALNTAGVLQGALASVA